MVDHGGRYDRPVVTTRRQVQARSARSSRVRGGVAPKRSAGIAVALIMFLGTTTAASANTVNVGQDPSVTTTSGAFGTEPETVPGETTGTAEPADTETSEVGEPDGESGTTSGRSAEIDAENRRILLIIAGLLAVAVALTLLTVRYWKATKPVPIRPGPVVGRPDADDDVLIAAPGATRRGKRSRMAVAGADHATSGSEWEPRGTGEHVRIDPPKASLGVRPSRDQRAAALASSKRR